MPVSNPVADLTIDYSLGTYAHVILGEPYGGINIDIINVPQDITVPADLTVIFENQTQALSLGPSWIPEVNLDNVSGYAIGLGDTVIYKLYSTDGGISWYGTMITPNSSRYVRITGDTMTGQLNQMVDGIVNNITYGQGPGGMGNQSNTVFGWSAMLNNTTGDRNTVFGSSAMAMNTTGFGNVAVGSSSLATNQTGNENVAIGALTATSLRGSGNVVIGRKALQLADSQYTQDTNTMYNTVIGYRAANQMETAYPFNPYTELNQAVHPYGNVILGYAGEFLQTAVKSVIIGHGAMNSTGLLAVQNLSIGNVVVGAAAMTRPNGYGTSGDVAIGANSRLDPADAGTMQVPFDAVQQATVSVGPNTMMGGRPASSVAVGAQALRVTTGSGNTAVGASAGNNTTSGANNVMIGYNAGNDAVASISSQSNYVVIGNNSTTNANIKVSWTVTSDARDKTDIQPIGVGLEFVNQLKPKQFKLMDRETQQATTGVRYGFLAQDVLESEGATPIIVDVTDADNLKMHESMVVPALVKAVQDLSAKLDAALSKIAALEAK